MDVTQYDPQAVANAEAQILHDLDRWPDQTRGEAVSDLIRAKAQVIADDIAAGRKPWAQQVEEYRYLRDLPWDGGQPPALASHEVSAS